MRSILCFEKWEETWIKGRLILRKAHMKIEIWKLIGLKLSLLLYLLEKKFHTQGFFYPSFKSLHKY